MTVMTARDVRRSFLEFFARHDHRIVPSAPLIPGDDPTLLFTNAGMNQFKDLFLGRERRDYVRAVTSQKCMRVSGKHNDLDNVGPSLRHHTFFEMLGNFSFGDYFKDEAIALAWKLLTEEWSISPDRLRATIFRGEGGVPRDDEAFEQWRRFLPPDRIDELAAADNFWAMGDTGPCGRCSEIHYHAGDHLPCTASTCRGTACDCDRYIEIWNNVFVEFDRTADGELTPLRSRSIDTGMGLERITAVLQGTSSNYDTDLFSPLLEALGAMAGVAYGRDGATDVSMRVVADHLRAMTFLIGDGVTPSNEWRGYVLRKLMRRAMRHGNGLGLTEPFLHALVDGVIAEMADAYPALRSARERIVQVVRHEEERFDAVLNAGLSKLEAALDRAAGGRRVVPAADVFKLHDSLGIPVDFVEDLASERQLTIDRTGFEALMQDQRERARAGSGFKTTDRERAWTAPDAVHAALTAAGDQFEGYARTDVTDATVIMIWDADSAPAERLTAGQDGYLSLDRTSFYVEAGGQVSDTGWISSADRTHKAAVVGMIGRPGTLPRVHHVRVDAGSFGRGDHVTADVDTTRRDAIRRNHTATHLLHAALRRRLGAHVTQAGSLVAPDRLRFDFSHQAPLTPDEIDDIERLVNAEILRNSPVQTREQAPDEAIAAGAIALFGEKYGDLVRVVSIPDFSVELCGGTHCRATGEIGAFTIEQEGGTAAGIRRIEALTGEAAVRRFQERRSVLRRLVGTLATSEPQVVEAAQRLQSDVKRLAREVNTLKVTVALGGEPDREAETEVAGVTVVARKTSGLDKAALRTMSDSLKGRLTSGVVVLASSTDAGGVAIVVSVTTDLKDRLPAGRIVKALAPIVGGRGGGRPDFAEAGGKDSTKIDTLLAESYTVVRRLLEGGEGGS